MLLLNCCKYVSKFVKLNSDYRTGKCVFISIPKKGNAEKNVQTTITLCSFHMLARLCWISFKLGFSSTWTEKFQMFSWISKRLRNQRSSCQHSFHHGESKGILEKHLLLLHWLCKAVDCVDYNKLWEILQEMGVTELTCLLSNLYAGQEATVRMGHGTTD